MARRVTQPNNEEFLHALYRGGELLAAGKVIEAKDHLEKAHQLQPKNEKGQNLLGLTYFKLGLFDRAAEIYEQLVQDNPADPTLRVNLGLVFLKANDLPRAIREFETAADLAPEHKKAQNYLGVALAQAGEFARAKEHFKEAGSDAMVEKMDRALRGEDVPKAPEPPTKQERFAEIEASEVVKAEEPPQVELMAEEIDGAAGKAEGGNHGLNGSDWGAQLPDPGSAAGVKPSSVEAEVSVASHAPAPAQPASVEVDVEVEAFSEEAMSGGAPAKPEEPKPVEVDVDVDVAEPEPESAKSEPPPSAPEPAAAPEIEPSSARSAGREGAAGAKGAAQAAPVAVAVGGAVEQEGVFEKPLAELAPALQAFPADLPGPFTVRGDLVAMACRDQMLMRLTGLVSIAGSLELKPEAKRFRGRATDKPFGEGEQRVVRAVGLGTVVVHAGKRKFVSMELDDESGYFQEDQVFAFEESLAFENGRVPSESPPDLDLVHLRGKGRVLLALQGPLRALQVAMQRPVIIPLQHLVGWYGGLTPRIAALLPDPRGKPTRVAVELSGEGFALIAGPVV